MTFFRWTSDTCINSQKCAKKKCTHAQKRTKSFQSVFRSWALSLLSLIVFDFFRSFMLTLWSLVSQSLTIWTSKPITEPTTTTSICFLPYILANGYLAGFNLAIRAICAFSLFQTLAASKQHVNVVIGLSSFLSLSLFLSPVSFLLLAMKLFLSWYHILPLLLFSLTSTFLHSFRYFSKCLQCVFLYTYTKKQKKIPYRIVTYPKKVIAELLA